MPDALIMGDVSYSDMEFFRLGQSKYITSPLISKVKPDDVLAKK